MFDFADGQSKENQTNIIKSDYNSNIMRYVLDDINPYVSEYTINIEHNIIEILDASHYYELDRLKDKCIEVMIKNPMQEYLNPSETYNLNIKLYLIDSLLKMHKFDKIDKKLALEIIKNSDDHINILKNFIESNFIPPGIILEKIKIDNFMELLYVFLAKYNESTVTFIEKLFSIIYREIRDIYKKSGNNKDALFYYLKKLESARDEYVTYKNDLDLIDCMKDEIYSIPLFDPEPDPVNWEEVQNIYDEPYSDDYTIYIEPGWGSEFE